MSLPTILFAKWWISKTILRSKVGIAFVSVANGMSKRGKGLKFKNVVVRWSVMFYDPFLGHFLYLSILKELESY